MKWLIETKKFKTGACLRLKKKCKRTTLARQALPIIMLLLMFFHVKCKEFDSQFLLKTGWEGEILAHLTTIKAVPGTPDYFFIYEYLWEQPVDSSSNEIVKFRVSMVNPSEPSESKVIRMKTRQETRGAWDVMAHYPNDHIVVVAYNEYRNRMRVQWHDLNSDERNNRQLAWKYTTEGCPKDECLGVTTSKIRSIAVVDKGSYEEIWMVQSKFIWQMITYRQTGYSDESGFAYAFADADGKVFALDWNDNVDCVTSPTTCSEATLGGNYNMQSMLQYPQSGVLVFFGSNQDANGNEILRIDWLNTALSGDAQTRNLVETTALSDSDAYTLHQQVFNMDYTDEWTQSYCFAAQVEWTSSGTRSIQVGFLDVQISSAVYEQTNKNMVTHLFDLTNTLTLLGVQHDKESSSSNNPYIRIFFEDLNNSKLILIRISYQTDASGNYVLNVAYERTSNYQFYSLEGEGSISDKNALNFADLQMSTWPNYFIFTYRTQNNFSGDSVSSTYVVKVSEYFGYGFSSFWGSETTTSSDFSNFRVLQTVQGTTGHVVYTGFFDRQNTVEYVETITSDTTRYNMDLQTSAAGWYWINDFSPCLDFSLSIDYSTINELYIMQSQTILIENENPDQTADEIILKSTRGGIYLKHDELDQNFFGISSFAEPLKSQVALCLNQQPLTNKIKKCDENEEIDWTNNMSLVSDTEIDALTQADAYIAVDQNDINLCYYYATDLMLPYPNDDTAIITKMPITRIRITEYFEDEDQQTSLTFCDYNRLGIQSSRIDFCGLANNYGIECPQVNAQKDIGVTIWQNQNPNPETEDEYDRLCQAFVIPYSGVYNAQGIYEWYSYPNESSSNYREILTAEDGYSVGEFHISHCHQWGADSSVSTWADNSDTWYVRFGTFDSQDWNFDSFDIIDAIEDASLSSTYPQWAFTKTTSSCSDTCSDDSLTVDFVPYEYETTTSTEYQLELQNLLVVHDIDQENPTKILIKSGSIPVASAFDFDVDYCGGLDLSLQQFTTNSIASISSVSWSINNDIEIQIQSQNEEDIGIHLIQLKFSYHDYPQISALWEFEVEITQAVSEHVYTEEEIQQVEKILEQGADELQGYIYINEELKTSYIINTGQELLIELPEFRASSGNSIIVDIITGDANFILVNEAELTILIPKGLTTYKEVGLYQVEIVVHDEGDTQITEIYLIEILVAESDCGPQEEMFCETKVVDGLENETCQCIESCAENQELICQIQDTQQNELCQCELPRQECSEGELVCTQEIGKEESCTCKVEQTCDPNDYVCRDVEIDNEIAQQCTCLTCAQEERICDKEGDNDKIVCQCPREDECKDEQRICILDGSSEASEICLCLDNTCEESEMICEKKLNKDLEEIDLCLCPTLGCAKDEQVCQSIVNQDGIEEEECECREKSKCKEDQKICQTKLDSDQIEQEVCICPLKQIDWSNASVISKNSQGQSNTVSQSIRASSNLEVFLSTKNDFKELPPLRTGVGAIFNVQEPRVRLKKLGNDSKLSFKFNNNILLPDSFKEIVEENQELRQLSEEVEPLIEIESLPGNDSDPDSLNLDWQIVDSHEAGLEFKLKFKDPLEVSQNDQPDKIKVKLNLDQFTDEYGQSLGNETTIATQVPRQIPDEEQVKSIQNGGEATELSSSSIMGIDFLFNFILSASLNQLWSMLNGLQLLVHLPLFNLKFPANASFMLNFTINVATFDFLPIEAIWWIFDFPEKGAFNLSFQSSGYEYIYLIENMGTCFYMVQIYLIMVLVTFILGILTKYTSIERTGKHYNALKKKLFFGAALRFIFEAYLEFGLCIIIGIYHLDWNQTNLSINYCSVFTVVFGALVTLMPFYVGLFYYFNIGKVEEQGFKQRHGALYEGLELAADQDKRKAALIYPLFFVIRRLVFLVTVIWLSHFFWSQIAIQFSASVASIIYLNYVWPFEEHLITKLEIFNEVISIQLCYVMLCFTDWVPKAQTRYYIGWFFIAVLVLHICVYIFFLILETVSNCKQKTKRKQQLKKAVQKQKEKQKALGQKKHEKVTKSKTNKNRNSNRGKPENILRDDPIQIDKKTGLQPVPETPSIEESDAFNQTVSIEFLARNSNQNHDEQLLSQEKPHQFQNLNAFKQHCLGKAKIKEVPWVELQQEIQKPDFYERTFYNGLNVDEKKKLNKLDQIQQEVNEQEFISLPGMLKNKFKSQKFTNRSNSLLSHEEDTIETQRQNPSRNNTQRQLVQTVVVMNNTEPIRQTKGKQNDNDKMKIKRDKIFKRQTPSPKVDPLCELEDLTPIEEIGH